MYRVETEAYRKYINEVKPKILGLLDKNSFMAHRSIQIILESEGYWHTVTKNAIEELRIEEKLRTAKYPTRGNYPKWVYKYELRINDIKEDIDKDYKPLYENSRARNVSDDIIDKNYLYDNSPRLPSSS